MFQCVELTETSSIWVDAAAPEFGMGFLNATRIAIQLNPEGAHDFSEPGDAYKVTLMAGMWPDDDELRLMVLGYSPGSEEAMDFLTDLGRAREVELLTSYDDQGMEVVEAAILIMPTFTTGKDMMVFVTGALPRGSAKDDAPNLQRVGAGAQNPTEMSFDMWRLMLDLQLQKRDLTLTGEEEVEGLRVIHSEGSTVEEAANTIASGRGSGTATVDAQPDVGG